MTHKSDHPSVADYFDQLSSTYNQEYDHESSSKGSIWLRMQSIQKISASFSPNQRVLDAGCGSGDLLLYLLKRGFDCAGTDLSAGMIKTAGNYLTKHGFSGVALHTTPLNKLDMFEDESFDLVYSLGVFPYIRPENDPASYQEIRRVLKKGALFISAHSNELFDLFTFNKYTLRFFENNLFPLLQSLGQSTEGFKERIEKLLVHPDKPINKNPEKSARDLLFLKAENPLTYAHKLAEYAFMSKSTYYYYFHALPPLAMGDDDDLRKMSRSLDEKIFDHWLGAFMASGFISVAEAV